MTELCIHCQVVENQLGRHEEEREAVMQPVTVEHRYALKHESSAALWGLRAILAEAVAQRQSYLDNARTALQRYLPGTYFHSVVCHCSGSLIYHLNMVT